MADAARQPSLAKRNGFAWAEAIATYLSTILAIV